MKKKIIFSIQLLLILFIFCDNNNAIPAFGRKYNMSCQTCHSPFPKLKAYGEEFAGNGFVLSDKDAPRYFVDTGDESLSLIRDIPLAFRLEGYVTYNNRNSEQSDFTTPYTLKLLSGGSLAKDIAYYFYFFFSERGDVAGIEDAFIMFNNLFDQDLDLYVGQFQVSDPLFKRELRLTFEDYQVYKTKPGLSIADLTYDRGIMLTYGLESGTDLIFEVLNGTGLSAVNNFRNFDNDKYKNVLGRVSQEITDNVRIGAFGYWGKEELTEFNIGFPNKIEIYGPDITLTVADQLEFNFQYVYRKDNRPEYFTLNTETTGAFGELIFTPEGDESKWYSVALYNWINSDLNALDYESGTLSLGYMLKRNIRLIGEFTYNFNIKFGQLSLGIISAF